MMPQYRKGELTLLIQPAILGFYSILGWEEMVLIVSQVSTRSALPLAISFYKLLMYLRRKTCKSQTETQNDTMERSASKWCNMLPKFYHSSLAHSETDVSNSVTLPECGLPTLTCRHSFGREMAPSNC